ncbi:MAG: glycosyltransferase [Patescibacteria group bacterium]
MISLVIPVYNFEGKLRATITHLDRWVRSRSDVLEIILVDDGSTDGTPAILRDVPAPIRVITLPANRGKGAAVRAGVLAAEGEYVFFTDIDLPYDFSAIDTALKEFSKGADLVCGSRHLPDSRFETKRRPERQLSSVIFSLLANTILLEPVADTQCGFKGVRADIGRIIFRELKTDGYTFDVDVLYLAQHRGDSIAFIPVTLVNESQTSIRLLRDGPSMGLALFALYMRTRTSLSRRDAYFIATLGIAVAVLLIPILHNLGIFAILTERGIPTSLTIAFLLLVVPAGLVCGAMGLALLPLHKHSAAEFSRYGIVGIFNTTLNMAIFNSLIFISGVSEGLIVTFFALITFAIVISQSFFWNMFWTFHHTPPQNRTRQYMRFFAVTSTTALVNLGIIHVLVNIVGAPAGISTTLWANIALLFTILTAILGNFLGYKFLVFAK